MENKEDQPTFEDDSVFAEPMPLPLLPVEDQKLYTAKELADKYHEGFVDGYNRAKDEIMEGVIHLKP